MKVYGYTYNNECAIDTHSITSFVYAHGELEKKCGYDLVYIPSYKSTYEMEDGEFIVDFIYPNGEEIKAKLFIWTDKYKTHHGLCVDLNDTEGYNWALQQYKKKAEQI